MKIEFSVTFRSAVLFEWESKDLRRIQAYIPSANLNFGG